MPGSRDRYSDAWLFLVIGVGLAAYLLHDLAGLFPANTKTLARDAAVAGFLGAALLVEELVRRLFIDAGRFAVVMFGWMGLVAAAMVLFKGSRIVAVISMSFVPVLVLRFGPGLLSEVSTKLRSARLIQRIGPSMRDYGPVVLGVALLVLALFLQLRSIDLSKG